MVRILVHQELLQPLDKARLQNLGNLDPRFLNQEFDRGNRYSVPYLWGTTGLGYDKERGVGPVDSWARALRPAEHGPHPDARRHARGLRRRAEDMGHSLNERDPRCWRRRRSCSRSRSRWSRPTTAATSPTSSAAGDVDLAHGYNGQLARLVAREPARLAYVVPKEGGDDLDGQRLHPRAGAQRRRDLRLPRLRPGARGQRARSSTAISYASANVPARQFIRPEILDDPAIYPPA